MPDKGQGKMQRSRSRSSSWSHFTILRILVLAGLCCLALVHFLWFSPEANNTLPRSTARRLQHEQHERVDLGTRTADSDEQAVGEATVDMHISPPKAILACTDDLPSCDGA